MTPLLLRGAMRFPGLYETFQSWSRFSYTWKKGENQRGTKEKQPCYNMRANVGSLTLSPTLPTVQAPTATRSWSRTVGRGEIEG